MQNISMGDIVAEHEAFKKAKALDLINEEQYLNAKKLGQSYAGLYLQQMINEFNKLIASAQAGAAKKAEAEVGPPTIPQQEQTV